VRVAADAANASTAARTYVDDGLSAATAAVDVGALDGAPGPNGTAAGRLAGVPGTAAALAAAHAADGRAPWEALRGVVAALAEGAPV